MNTYQPLNATRSRIDSRMFTRSQVAEVKMQAEHDAKQGIRRIRERSLVFAHFMQRYADKLPKEAAQIIERFEREMATDA